MKAAGDFQKTRALVRSISIDAPRPDVRIVAQDRYRPTTESAKSGEQTSAETRLEFEEAAFIGDQRRYFAHLVRLAIVCGNE